MGKSRFGYEAYRQNVEWATKEKGMSHWKYLRVDFNGSGPLSSSEVQLHPSEAIALRIFAAALNKTSYTVFNIIPNSAHALLTVESVFSFLAKSLRVSGGEVNTVGFLLHIDEFQQAHKSAVAFKKEKFVSEMIQAVGVYRCGESNFLTSFDENIFVLPILTGTSPEGPAFAVSKFGSTPLTLDPLSLQQSFAILRGRLGVSKSNIEKDPAFIRFLMDLGGVPRYLRYLMRLIIDTPSYNRLWNEDLAHLPFELPFLGRDIMVLAQVRSAVSSILVRRPLS